MRPFFFLSYAHSDGIELADLLTETLEGHDVKLWRDTSAICPGRKWDDEISEALDNCEALLFLMTTDSVRNENCLNEIARAGLRGQLIIPLKMSHDLIPPLRLTRSQSIDFTGDFSTAVSRLVTFLRASDQLNDERRKAARAVSVSHTVSAARPYPEASMLQSITASSERRSPECSPAVQWKFLVPQKAGEWELKASTVMDHHWRHLLAFDDASKRWLVRPNKPRSFELPIDVEFSTPFPARQIDDIQVALSVGAKARFALYLRFDRQHWICYSPNATATIKSNRFEFEVPAPDLIAGTSLVTFERSIREDLNSTWHSINTFPKMLTGLRFRGDFRVSSIYIT